MERASWSRAQAHEKAEAGSPEAARTKPGSYATPESDSAGPEFAVWISVGPSDGGDDDPVAMDDSIYG
jgi:hypothetical protein